MIWLADEHWERIRKHFPEENIPEGRPGRKTIPTQKVLEAVLWFLNTGAQWHMLLQCYPNYKTFHRRFEQWCREEVLRDVLTDLANAFRDVSPTLRIKHSNPIADHKYARWTGGYIHKLPRYRPSIRICFRCPRSERPWNNRATSALGV